jgi:hypothetical protein
MSAFKFLSLPTAAFVALIAVPLLLLLYFLKLRRQERKISSTLLWKKAIQDLQVNSPFQKLRRNLLLFLQLLILVAVLFGLANPVTNFTRQPEKSIVILIDHSGSMKSIEADGHSRLEHAKDTATQFISELPKNSRAMVISFADRANVVCSFTDDKRRLARQIGQIEPTSGPSRIAEALQLAVAYSSSLVEEKGGGVPQAAQQGVADIELFSDGRIADADKQFLTRGNLSYYRVGQSGDNVGIVAFDVRRDFERPGVLSVFVQVENFGPLPVKADVTLSLDGKLLPGAGSVREVSMGPAVSTSGPARKEDLNALPASQNVIFELQHDAGGVLEVEWHRPDALMIDNKVTAPIDPPRPIRVLAVTDRPEVRRFLGKAMAGFSVEGFEIKGPGDYEATPDAQLMVEGRSVYDLVILDNHDTDTLPPGNYIFFGGAPKIDGVSIGEEIVGKPIVFGRESHALLHAVNYDNLYVAKWRQLVLPSHALRLLEGEDSIVMALLADPGHRLVIFAFDLLDSDFALRPAFPIFLQNAISFLAGGGLVEASRLITPGDTMTLDVPPGAERLRITRPEGRVEDLDVRGRATATYARTRDTGLYKAEFDDSRKTADTFAVNMLDEVESRITPKADFTIGSEKVDSYEAAKRVNEALWPYAAAVALAFLLLEWWVYNRRVMI